MDGNIKWSVIAAKAPGTSHLRKGEGCEDYYSVEVVNGHSACFIVSDGAGSAQMGAEGAKTVCEGAVNFIRRNVEPWTDASSYELLEYLIDLLNAKAAECGLSIRELACTFVGAFFSAGKAHYVQIGDGGIVIKDDDGEHSVYRPVFWPKNGEYANMTYFITDGNALANTQTKSDQPIPYRLALFTDGIQRLCLNYENEAAHAPFFNKMFDAVDKAHTHEEFLLLNTKLQEFLSSDAVNQRTDDDKTLVLAVSNRVV